MRCESEVREFLGEVVIALGECEDHDEMARLMPRRIALVSALDWCLCGDVTTANLRLLLDTEKNAVKSAKKLAKQIFGGLNNE